MAAGVKTAAIVNYEKYVTHPAPVAPAKKDAKLKANGGAKAAVHHALAKPAPAKPAPVKQAPVKPVAVNQAALKAKGNACASRCHNECRRVASGCAAVVRRRYHGPEEAECWNSEGDSAELAIIMMTSVIYAGMSPISLPPLMLGSAKTSVLVAELSENGLRYRGHGISESRGLRKGVITELDKAVGSIQKAVEHAEDVAGIPIEHALIGDCGRAHSRDEQSRRDCFWCAVARDCPG